jgi:hypothetical protein
MSASTMTMRATLAMVVDPELAMVVRVTTTVSCG